MGGMINQILMAQTETNHAAQGCGATEKNRAQVEPRTV
jgi:hypothetical protein